MLYFDIYFYFIFFHIYVDNKKNKNFKLNIVFFIIFVYNNITETHLERTTRIQGLVI